MLDSGLRRNDENVNLLSFLRKQESSKLLNGCIKYIHPDFLRSYETKQLVTNISHVPAQFSSKTNIMNKPQNLFLEFYSSINSRILRNQSSRRQPEYGGKMVELVSSKALIMCVS